MAVKPLRDWTLRTRLIVSLLGLFVVLSVSIGAFTEVALRSFLIDRLDQQLTSAGGRSDRIFREPVNGESPGSLTEQPGGGVVTQQPYGEVSTESGGSATQQFGMTGSDASRFLLPPGSPPGAIGVEAGSSGVVNARVLTDEGIPGTPDDATAAALAKVTSETPTDVSVPGLGDYRAVAHPTPSGSTIVIAFPLAGVKATLMHLTWIITALTAGGLAIAAATGALIVRLALRPLRRVTATAARVAEMQLHTGEVALSERVPDENPHTEVGQVGVALNRMLENVSDALSARHRSETRVRQFVADASHELRTPLASIRGYAELTRRSLVAAPDDVRHAMSRVEAEASRMTTLVEDLLLLARLDAGRPLEAHEVDITRLLLDAVSDAHVASPDHKWLLEVPDDPITVTGDDARLHQVVTNLLANARTHTPAGTTVTASLEVVGGWARIGVRDDGPGIPSGQLSEVFERFTRGEESRTRATGSTGLGLSIAQAVVHAHSGRIEVSSVPGETVFSVWLPIHGNTQAIAQEPARLLPQSLEV